MQKTQPRLPGKARHTDIKIRLACREREPCRDGRDFSVWCSDHALVTKLDIVAPSV